MLWVWLGGISNLAFLACTVVAAWRGQEQTALLWFIVFLLCGREYLNDLEKYRDKLRASLGERNVGT
jgi:hypothetical protein